MRILNLMALALSLASIAHGQTDWPLIGHDAGGTRYSPLKQINSKNVTKLQLAWSFDTEAPVVDPPGRGRRGGDAALTPVAAPDRGGTPGGTPALPRVRQSKTTPLVVGDVMYVGTPYNRVLALDAYTGKKIWEFEAQYSASPRGISYWPGDGQYPPTVVFGASGGRLVALNAKTGKLIPGFGNEGVVDLRPGVADHFPNGHYSMSTPPAIYKNLVITGAQVQEEPAKGPAGDVRAWDLRTGKLVWTFHTVPHTGEANHDVWQGDEWVDISGANVWGFMTVDVQNGLVFLPIGTPTPDFFGGDRKGSNLYGSSVVALDAATGKMKWFFQTTHHDNWDYDDTAAPVLIDIKRNGQKIPAVAQSTKQGLMFFFDRFTGKPIYDVEERPVLNDNPMPGDQNWPTQPFPVKPPPLARNTFSEEDVAKVTPEHEKFCRDLLKLEGGVMMGGPYAQYGPKLRVIFPGWTGGGNWGGISYDPKLGYVFFNIKNDGMLSKMVQNADGTWKRVGPEHAPPGVGSSFQRGPWPCVKPPWGELSAVNVNTGDIVWRVPLGSYAELDALGVPPTGTSNSGGSTATAGELVFIGATVDKKFRAFDSRTGKVLWETTLDSNATTIPVTYQDKRGKQYVAVMSSGSGGSQRATPHLYVFALP
jgi:glucose dehydrogenase